MKKINIEWQRLVIENETCPRCGGTEQELEKAVLQLKDMGIHVELKKKEMSEADFRKDPQASNRILIAGEPLERWLEAETGKSKCCSACGDNQCRTVEMDGRMFEMIPSELIIEAAQKAAKELR